MIKFFKSLFGSPAKEEIQAATAFAHAGEGVIKTSYYQVDGDFEFYPFFARFDWDENIGGSVVEVFHYTEKEEPAVLVNFVKKDASKFHLMDTSELEEGVFEAVKRHAYEKLEKLQLSFTFVKNTDRKVLIGDPSHFACEKIMCAAHMREAQRMLNAEQILVSIARRGVMLVAACSEDEAEEQPFFDLHADVWSGAIFGDHQLLTDDVFVMKNGELESVYYMELDEEEEEEAAE